MFNSFNIIIGRILRTSGTRNPSLEPKSSLALFQAFIFDLIRPVSESKGLP
jgi:hypothetical protein